MRAGLVVGQANDPFEHEADRVADQVMQGHGAGLPIASAMPKPGGKYAARKSEETKMVEPKPEATAQDIAGNAPGMVPEALRSPGQPLDASARALFEPRFGADFSRVRLHHDALAARSAAAIGAKAYTVGADIVFGAGRYQPGSSAGQRLLAHELAHVVQQGGGAAGLVQAVHVGVQRAVETLGGEWDTGTYKVVNDGANDIGVEMDRLIFKAKDPVDATKIGLTQMVNSIENGSPTALNPTVQSRSIPAGKTDAGSHIDRLAERANPMYGMNDPTDAKKTLGGSVTAGNSQWGFHYRAKPTDATAQHQDANLYDRPTLPAHGANSSQLFETSALAVEGTQAGTFYGSVRWGWRSDATNKLTIEPLSVVSVGVPSATFRQASTLWNAGKTSTGADTVGLTIAAGSASTQLPSAMTDEQITARLAQIDKELLAAPAGQTTESLNFEKRALEKEQHFRKMGDFPQAAKNPQTAMG